jgi:hypothetical protein
MPLVKSGLRLSRKAENASFASAERTCALNSSFSAFIAVLICSRNGCWSSEDVPSEHAIRGFHSVTLLLDSAQKTAAILTDVFGFREIAVRDR